MTRHIPAPPADFRGTFRTDSEARDVYSEAAGVGRVIPAAVAVASSAEDVVTLVRWAANASVPVTPRGSGTSMANGAIGEGVILDLSRLKEIREIDAATRSVWVEPGALRNAVNDAAGLKGLRFPVDPSSGPYCTVGGMAATNAAGAHSLHFGATRAWVNAIDCVFADGTRAIVRRGEIPAAQIRAVARFLSWSDSEAGGRARFTDVRHAGVRKESSGYGLSAFAESGELVDLLVGSEGTLAVFVGLELGLTDLPGATCGVLGSFQSLEDAAVAAAIAVEAGAVACELLDRTFLATAATKLGEDAEGNPVTIEPIAALATLPPRTEAVLLAEVESATEAGAAAAAHAVAEAFRVAGAAAASVALTVDARREIWELRHAASPIVGALGPALISMQLIEDGTVPPDRLPEYVRGVRAALEERQIRGAIFGHAGDANVHVNPLVDVRRPGWMNDIRALLEETVSLTARLGGTLAGEHGDGTLRAPLLPRVWSATAIELFALVKRCFDPNGILNPGVKVALPGQEPLGAIKHDPALAPLGARARAALDRVVRERAYSEARLSLLEG